jgi:hypothetical protein
MSSGTTAEGGDQVAVAAEEGPGLAPQGDGLGAVEAVSAAGAGAAGAAFACAGARALAAVEAAAAVAHGRLPAGAAGAAAGAAAWDGQEIAGRIAILEPPAIELDRSLQRIGISIRDHEITPF